MAEESLTKDGKLMPHVRQSQFKAMAYFAAAAASLHSERGGGGFEEALMQEQQTVLEMKRAAGIADFKDADTLEHFRLMMIAVARQVIRKLEAA